MELRFLKKIVNILYLFVIAFGNELDLELLNSCRIQVVPYKLYSQNNVNTDFGSLKQRTSSLGILLY